MQDITIRHPQYDAFAESWRQVRDANAGEDDIKQAGERYLPMKSGQAAISLSPPSASQPGSHTLSHAFR
ncbi:hypothetical protein [Gemmobacter sp. 24YEA27]|uniref:hypothetical protein n=1 Tax=Gemmobacter sp. 24YEA27 TaxID=3040672 RepID=UPI0024B39E70|nr:hypothetical protein [Gemmobacter sp. 24YEA27]